MKDINFVDFMVTLLRICKISSANISFIGIHSIGRIRLSLENIIMKNLFKRSSAK